MKHDPVTLFHLSLQALHDNEAMAILADVYEELGEKKTAAHLRATLEMRATFRLVPFFVLIDPKEPDCKLEERKPLAVLWHGDRAFTEYKKKCRRRNKTFNWARARLWRVDLIGHGLCPTEAETISRHPKPFIVSWRPLDAWGKRIERMMFKGPAARIALEIRGFELNPSFRSPATQAVLESGLPGLFADDPPTQE